MGECIAGVDEAGRGPLAGPVVAAAVILPNGASPSPFPFRDSKTISHERRVILHDWLFASGAAIGIGIVEPGEIDRINILQAALLAMRIAVERLDPRPDKILIDGNQAIPRFDIAQETIVKGDAKIPAISAASIIAKVTRDRIMGELHTQYPQYGFDKHKGYGTKEHRDAILKHGPAVIHRKTFAGVCSRELPAEPQK